MQDPRFRLLGSGADVARHDLQRRLSPLPVDQPLQAGDTMLLVGAHEDLTRAVARLERV